MPHSLTSTQREYLNFVREYIQANESSPRLEEIAEHFRVKAPTAHKILETLQSKGYLYFRRDPVSGFFIRLIERAGSAEVVMVKIQTELISYDQYNTQMPVEISLVDDMIIVKAQNGAAVAMSIDDENLTLLAWANDDGKHDPDLVLPVPNDTEDPS